MTQPRDSQGRFREADRSLGQGVADIIAAKDAPKLDNPVTRALRNPHSESRSVERDLPIRREPNRHPWNLYGSNTAKPNIRRSQDPTEGQRPSHLGRAGEPGTS
jgi:hypothetical protein